MDNKMTYEELVKNDLPRWVVVNLSDNRILAEEWTWSNADFAALQAERTYYGDHICIYDRMDADDCERIKIFRKGY